MIKITRLLFLFWFLAGTPLPAQIMIGVNLDSGSLTLKNSDDSTLLSGGVAATVGDGDVVQFGYYSAGTVSNPFAGTWVPLTGQGGPNSAFATTSIGDNPDSVGLTNTNGTFAFTDAGATAGDVYLNFIEGSSTSGVSLPHAGQIMALRFYNGTTAGNSTFYGAVSAANWSWITPSNAPNSMNFSLDDPQLSWLNGDVAFTGTPTGTPEPRGVILFGLGLVALAFTSWCRRKTSLS